MTAPFTIVSVSPATAPVGTLTRTSTKPDNSVALIFPSLLPSSKIVTTGAAVAEVSRTALSKPAADTLPRESVTVAVTVNVPPSAGGENSVSTVPASTCAAVKVNVCTVLPSVTRNTSPATAVTGKPTDTPALPDNSVDEMRPSLLVSSVMVTVGAADAVVLRNAVSLPCGEVLPAASRTVATTVTLLPAGGGVKLVVTTPAPICAAVSVNTCVLLPLETVNTSPATALTGRAIDTSMLPDNSAGAMEPSLLVSSVMVTVGADGAAVSRTALSVAVGDTLPA